MDFDEYDYLEKAVEDTELPKGKETSNGGDGTGKHGEKERSRGSKHDSDENDRDSERVSKRSRSGDDAREQDRHRERSSSHRSSRPRDEERSGLDRRSSRDHRERDRDKDKDREERNGRQKDRDKEKERDRERRDRDGERDRDRGRENDKEVERSHKSGSRSERHRGEHEERAKEKSQDRETREREKEKEKEREKEKEKEKEREREREIRERDKESRYARAISRWSFWQLSQKCWRHKEKKEEAEPEADPERDQRTVFAYQISLKADERDVYEFFSRAGKVRDVRLIMDRNSRRSKGVGYIEFYDVMAVPMAIALSGQPLLGQPVMVKPSEAEKNLVQPTATAAGGAGGLTSPYSGGARKLYVGNLHFNINEELLRSVFEPFGTVELVQLPLDETGLCKGFGFIQFARLEDARAAQGLNGQLEIAGRMIKVSAVTDQAGMQDAGANTADFDDDEGGGLSLNARSRAILMQKLDRTGIASNIAGSLTAPAVTPGLPLPPAPLFGASGIPSLLPTIASALPGVVPTVDTIGVPSECLLLKNMFDPNTDTDPDFELDIKEDVEDECSKYGKVKHIYVEKNSAGFVYLRFDNTQSASSAQRALHGRWFAGKMITATFMTPQTYEAKFPNSA